MADFDFDLLKHSTLSSHADKSFRACRGDVITHIDDLANCIESLSLAEFTHHVDTNHNDFAQWVEDVLENPLLARDLRLTVNVSSKDHCVKTIRDHVGWLRGY